MNNKFSAALTGAALTLIAGAANAAVFNETLLGVADSVDFGTVTNEDQLAVNGSIAGNNIVFEHSTFFTLSSTATGVDSDIAVFTVKRSLINFFSAALYTNDIFIGEFQMVEDGTAVDVFALMNMGLVAGTDYEVRVTGLSVRDGNYDLKVGITPIPAAAALLVPALAGLGFAARRRA